MELLTFRSTTERYHIGSKPGGEKLIEVLWFQALMGLMCHVHVHTQDLKPTIPSSQGCYCYSIFILTYNLLSVCACGFLSRCGCLLVSVYIYDCVHPCTAYTCTYTYMYMYITAYCPFLRLSLLSLFPILSLMLVCYTHIFHVRTHTCMCTCTCTICTCRCT